jgi:ribosomal protein S18 acetylase RimI-like enzyme
MDVRNAVITEYNLVADLNVEAYREFATSIGPEHWTTMEANLRNVGGRAKESQLVVAEDGDTVIGAVVYYPPGSPRSFALARMIPSTSAYLGVLAVTPARRREGVARQLTTECIHRADRDRSDEMWLVTSDLMTSARGLYEGMGFRKRDETVHYDRRYWSYSIPIQDTRVPA